MALSTSAALASCVLMFVYAQSMPYLSILHITKQIYSPIHAEHAANDALNRASDGVLFSFAMRECLICGPFRYGITSVILAKKEKNYSISYLLQDKIFLCNM